MLVLRVVLVVDDDQSDCHEESPVVPIISDYHLLPEITLESRLLLLLIEDRLDENDFSSSADSKSYPSQQFVYFAVREV